MCPGKQIQLGRWFLVLHSALRPHLSNGQGSWHSLLMQALAKGHSESLLHPAKNNQEYPHLEPWIFKRYLYILVLMTTNLTFFTKWIWISNISRNANTNGTVVFDFAFCILTTRVGITWILTLFLYTCKVFRTVRINRAFRFWCWK